MFLIDTNVLVFLLLHGERTPEARALFKADKDWRSEMFLLIEFSNVLATYVLERELSREKAMQLLSAAEMVMHPGLVSVAHSEALETAIQYEVSVYDGKFLTLARQFDRRLVTEDAKLRRAAPQLTQSVKDAMHEFTTP